MHRLAVLVAGKVRAKIQVSKDEDKASIEKQALENEQVKKWLDGKKIKQVLVVPGRVVNVVLG